jgi:hypothetical protein
MPKFTIAVGVFLILIGVVAYVASGAASFTAFIPSIFGLLLAGFGYVAQNPARTKSFMHFAALLAVVGLLGSIQGIPQALALASGAEVDRPMAAISRAVMAVTLLVFLVMAVRSFIEARKARRAAEAKA